MDHLTQEQIEQYRTGNLGTARAYQDADAHVATCNYCRGRLLQSSDGAATPQTLSRLLEGPAAPYDHPSPDVVVDYVHDRASVSPLAAAHIDACSRCREDAADLRGYLRGLE